MVMPSRVAGKRPAGTGGESKRIEVSLLKVVPFAGKWKKKETKGTMTAEGKRVGCRQRCRCSCR